MRFLLKSGRYKAKDGTRFKPGDVITTDDDLNALYGKKFERVANFTVGKNENVEEMDKVSEEEYLEKVKIEEAKSEAPKVDVTEDFIPLPGFTVTKSADAKGKDVWLVAQNGDVVTKEPLTSISAVNKFLKEQKKHLAGE